MSAILKLVVFLVLGDVSASAQPGEAPKWTAKTPPRFEDFPVKEIWHGTAAPVKLVIRSERMFRTKLTNAAMEPPNFAGHYRLTFWGCGSECAAGALIDLQTGEVFQPPGSTPNGSGWERWMIGGMMEDSGIDFRADCRLVVIRTGINYSERLKKNFPDAYYYVRENNRFRRILFVSGMHSAR